VAHARQQHPNAVLTPTGRLRMVRCVVEAGWTVEATADRFQVDAKTVRKWRDRFVTEGVDGLQDRSSRPITSPTQTPSPIERRAVALRRRHRWGAAHIGHELGLAASTVQAILHRHGCNRLDRGDRATAAEPPRRYQRRRPGELAHVDVKKISGIPTGGGWRIHGRGHTPAKRSTTGYRFIHTAIDDCTRLAYSEIHDDEQAITAAEFWRRAYAWFAAHSVHFERVLTDNGSCYRSALWKAACAETGTTPNEPVPTGPKPTARSNGSIASCSRNGPTSDPGAPTVNAPSPTTGSSTSTISTDPTAHSAGPHQ
jgi:transposase-like protein